MKLTIERQALLKGIERVRSVVEARNTIPILSNVRLEVIEGELIVTATDLDIEVTARCPAPSLVSGAAGSVCVPAGTLHDLVRKLPEGADVSLAVVDGDPRLTIKAGRSSFKLPVLPAGDFPSMGVGTLPAPVTIDAGMLARLIDKVAFAMSTEQTRYYLNGVYLHVVGDCLRAVATDGHRLAAASAPVPDGLKDMPGVIIPRKAVREVRRLLDGLEKVEVQISREKLRIGDHAARIVSKAIDGTFPDYERIIPRDNQNVAEVNCQALSTAVDRVATISSDKSRSSKLEFTEGRLVITVRNQEAGQAIEEMEVAYTGGDMTVGFNARYLLDALSKIDADEVNISMSDPASPTLISDPADPGLRLVVMPLRV